MISQPSPIILSISLLLTLSVLFVLAPRILPPRIIPDDPDDIALLHRASLFRPPPKSRLATATKPKIAFLFLTNSDLHFAPLWERFFNPKQNQELGDLYNIYIHADPFSPYTSPGGVFEDRLIKAKRTQRASPSLISAARRLIATAILKDPANMFFALVSQHCIPLHSFRFVYRTLFTLPVRTMESDSDPELVRFGYQSFIEIQSRAPKLWERYTARGKNAFLPEVPFEKFRVGSQFFVLTRKHAMIVVRDRRLWKKFRLPCLRTESCYPEEHYFPTLLSMQDPNGCSHYALTRVNWTGTSHGHPHTYRPEELSSGKLIEQLRFSNSTFSYLFARKFSPDCLKPLLDIADKTIFRD